MFYLFNLGDFKTLKLGGSINDSDIKNRAAFLKKMEIFKIPDVESIINQFLVRSTCQIYEEGKVILQEGKPNNNLFIILSGSVTLTKTILKTCKQAPATATSASSQPQLKVLGVRRTVIQINTLLPGQIFPEIVNPEHFSPSTTAWKIRNTNPGQDIELQSQQATNQCDSEVKHILDEKGYDIPSFSTVTANTFTRCLVIPRLDFIRVSAPSMIRHAWEHDLLECYFTAASINEAYGVVQDWKDWKKKEVEQLVKDIRVRKNWERDRIISGII